MDLNVEKTCLKDIKKDNLDKFIYLYDAYFEKLYKYVARRISNPSEVDSIVRTVFVEALSKVKGIPEGLVFNVWLYSLARKHVLACFDKNKTMRDAGLIVGDNIDEEGEELAMKAKKILNKLSFEEREILRLKFFEEVSDGDISYVLNQGQAAIGPRIYRVLKRTHFLLFGESDERQGIYFGELSGFLSRLKGLELIEVPEVFKLNLRIEILKKIERKDFAIDAGQIEKTLKRKTISKKHSGSNDPAKVFVEAVKEMSEEERKSWSTRSPEKPKEKEEKFYVFISKWRYLLILLPLVLFVLFFSFVLFRLHDIVNRNACDYQAVYLSGLTEKEVIFIQEDFNKRICEEFEVNYLIAGKLAEEKLIVRVDLYEYVVKYTLVERSDKWFIEKYEKYTYSNEESGKIWRNP